MLSFICTSLGSHTTGTKDAAAPFRCSNQVFYKLPPSRDGEWFKFPLKRGVTNAECTVDDSVCLVWGSVLTIKLMALRKYCGLRKITPLCWPEMLKMEKCSEWTMETLTTRRGRWTIPTLLSVSRSLLGEQFVVPLIFIMTSGPETWSWSAKHWRAWNWAKINLSSL